MAYGKSAVAAPKVVKLEILVAKKDETMLREVCETIQRIANLAVDVFRDYHHAHGTREKLAAGERACAMPPALSAAIRAAAFAHYPRLTYATMNAAVRWFDRTVSNQDSPKFNGKRWRMALLHREAFWSFTSPLPIRLWSGNCRAGFDEQGPFLVVSLVREVAAGQVRGRSVPLVLRPLKPKASDFRHRGTHVSYAQMYGCLVACARGERRMAQSQLWREPRSGKWFLSLTVDRGELAPPASATTAAKDPRLTLFVRAGNGVALRIHTATRAGGFGEEFLDRVSRCRRRLDERRRSLRAKFGEALPKRLRDQLAAKWRGEAVAICHALATQVARALAGEPYGRVVWLDGNNRRNGLAMAGKAGAQDQRELFPFELLRRLATEKLSALGIEVLGRANFRSVKRRKTERRKRVAAGVVQ